MRIRYVEPSWALWIPGSFLPTFQNATTPAGAFTVRSSAGGASVPNGASPAKTPGVAGSEKACQAYPRTIEAFTF